MKKILVADDDPAIVDAVQMILALQGYVVETTVDGRQVYNVEHEPPDLLLLDIWMSGEDGREICRYLRSQPQTKDLPIVMISASRDIGESARKAGADAFLPKPFDIDRLLQVIQQQLH